MNSVSNEGFVTLKVASYAGELTKGQRARLKSNGFKYSFTNRCWSRRVKQSNAGLAMAKAISVAPVVKY